MASPAWHLISDGDLDSYFTYPDAYVKLLMHEPRRLRPECVRLVETERLFAYTFEGRLVIYVREDLVR